MSFAFAVLIPSISKRIYYIYCRYTASYEYLFWVPFTAERVPKERVDKTRDAIHTFQNSTYLSYALRKAATEKRNLPGSYCKYSGHSI
jgi:hypothetical protein